MTRAASTAATIEGLGFPEALRWRSGALWFSDMFRGRVVRWQPGSAPATVLDVNGGGPVMPGGLGWLPDGRMLVVDCLERRVLAVDCAGHVSVHADLAGEAQHPLNDMHVDPDGTAWVGGYGFDPDVEAPTPSALLRIDPDGAVTRTATSLIFPNGCERTELGLVVAETFADRLSMVGDDGRSRVLAEFSPNSGPDGLSIAPDGTIWVALAFAGLLVRVTSDGETSAVALAHPPRESAWKRGVFDCAVHPGGRVVAVATAAADEAVAQQRDTGSITCFTLD